MGKVLISDNMNWKDILNEKFCNAGFKTNGVLNNIIVYDKLNANTENFLRISDTEMIACNGTLVYKDLIGKVALKTLYDDYIKNGCDIQKIRKECFGSYFLLIKTSNQLICFVDETGTYAMHYYNGEGSFLITNTYYHIESVVHEKINKNACIEELLEYCVYDNETPFENIFRIMPEDVLCISDDDSNIHILNCEVNSYTLKSTNFNEISEEIKDTIIRYTSKMALFSKKPIMFMTGGVDSRLSLATYIAAGLNPVVCSWYGNGLKMNTKDEDVKISKKIAQTMGLEFVDIDVSEDDNTLTMISRKLIEKYGEWAVIYGGNKKWFDIFEKGVNHTYEFGYFGEIFKGWELIDTIQGDSITIDEFCGIYTGRQGYSFDTKSTFDEEAYKSNVHKKLRGMAERYGMNLNKLSKEDCMILYYRYRLHADTKCVNLANVFGFCTPILANKEVADLINQCPYKYKERDKINLHVTNMIDKRLINIQYFTHTRYMSLDKENMVLVDATSKKKSKALINVIKALGGDKLLGRIKKNIIVKDRGKMAFFTRYAEEINNYPYFRSCGIIVNESTFNYIPLAVSMLCKSILIDCTMQ